MYGRSRTPASLRGDQRRMVRQTHPLSIETAGEDWMGAHRAARMEASCREAQDRAIALWIARGGWR